MAVSRGCVLRKVVGLGYVAAAWTAAAATSAWAQPDSPDVAVDTDDIGGVVTGPNGPEAGVCPKISIHT